MYKNYKKLAKFTQRIKTVYIKGIKPKKFLSILKNLKIDVVVDIRYSSVYPIYFAPKNLRELLVENEIEYIRFQKLGNPKKLRNRAGENFELARELYRKHILKNHKEYLTDLFKLINRRVNKNYALLCYCPTFDPKLCHRFWLREVLISIKRIRLGFEGEFKLEYVSKNKIAQEE